MKKRVLMLLGGSWHDFDGFARSLCPLLKAANWDVETSHDLQHLARLDDRACDLVLNYTCFAKHTEGLGQGPEGMSATQVEGLTRWVRAGGAFLSVHAASVRGESGVGLSTLTGGAFVEHPPACVFTVYPLYGPHPITTGIEAFQVDDEMYIEQCQAGVNVHMLAVQAGVAYPLVWSKSEGRGRVAHIALGHSEAVWELGPYRRLLLQTAGWLTHQETELQG